MKKVDCQVGGVETGYTLQNLDVIFLEQRLSSVAFPSYNINDLLVVHWILLDNVMKLLLP